MKAPSRSTLAVYVVCVASLALPGQAAAAAYTVNASQDTYVDSANAGVSMGTGSLANIDYNSSGDQRIALVKFTVPSLAAGETVNNVKLRVNVVNPGTGSTAAYAVGTGWSEATTWNSRPSIGSKLSASSGAVPTGWFTYDLGKPLTQGGTYAFAIQTTGSDGVQFTTRENTSATPAQLVVSTTSVTTYRTVKLGADADTYVDSTAPSKSMVAGDLVNVDYNSSADQRIALLRFIVPTLAAGETITDSKLRINVVNPGGGATAVYQAGTFANDATWKTRPSIGTKLTATSGAVPTGWFTYGLGTAITTAGTHSLAIQTTHSDGLQFTSRSSTPAAELELTIASTGSSPTTAPPTAPTTAPTPTTPAPTSSKPTASNTGFLGDKAKLTKHVGNFTAGTNGQVIEGREILGRVIVKANNVTIRNSIIRGGQKAAEANGPLLQAWNDNTGLLIENVTFAPTLQNYSQDGIRVQQATIRNVNVSGTVDGIGVQSTMSGQSTRIENSWVGNLYVTSVPKSVHDDLITHNDGLQMHGGAYRITVTNSNLNGAASGAAIMMAAGAPTSGQLTATKSWFGGGGCSINIAEKSKGAYSGVSITNNVFARGTTKVKDCAIVAGSATKGKWTASGNKFDDGAAISSSLGIK